MNDGGAKDRTAQTAAAGGGNAKRAMLGGGAALVILIGLVLAFGSRTQDTAQETPTTTAAGDGAPVALAQPEAAAPAQAPSAPAQNETAANPAQTVQAPVAEAADPAQVEVASPEPAGTDTPAPETMAKAAEDVAQFDQLRASADGMITLAGHAEPGAKVEVLLDGEVIDTVTALAGGSFASVASAGGSAAGRLLTVRVTGADGVARESETSVIVDPGSEAPVVEVSETEGARVIAAAEPAQFSVDTFAAAEDAQGGTISGRGAPAGALIRAYLDGAEAGLAAPAADGSWSIVLPRVAAGAHVLRVDALAADGNVLARAETEFTKQAAEPEAGAAEGAPVAEASASVAAEAVPETAAPSDVGASDVAAAPAEAEQPAPGARLRRIEVAKGDTLWAIAGAAYGDPLLYVQVFAANAGQIRDPNKIYPGQVFTIPE